MELAAGIYNLKHTSYIYFKVTGHDLTYLEFEGT